MWLHSRQPAPLRMFLKSSEGTRKGTFQTQAHWGHEEQQIRNTNHSVIGQGTGHSGTMTVLMAETCQMLTLIKPYQWHKLFLLYLGILSSQRKRAVCGLNSPDTGLYRQQSPNVWPAFFTLMSFLHRGYAQESRKKLRGLSPPVKDSLHPTYLFKMVHLLKKGHSPHLPAEHNPYLAYQRQSPIHIPSKMMLHYSCVEDGTHSSHLLKMASIPSTYQRWNLPCPPIKDGATQPTCQRWRPPRHCEHCSGVRAGRWQGGSRLSQLWSGGKKKRSAAHSSLPVAG